MSKSRWTVSLASGIVLAGLAVGAVAYLSSAGVVAQSEAVPPSLEWMPASADLVGHIDWLAFVNSPLRDVWREELEEHGPSREIEAFREATGLDPFKDVYAASFSAVSGGGENDGPRPERWGLAVRGRVDQERLVQNLGKHGAVHREEYEGETIYRSTGKGGAELAFAFPEGETILLAPPGYLREMLDAGSGRRASAITNLLESWNQDTLTGETFWVVGSPERGLEDVLKTPQGGELPPIRSFALSGRLETDVAVRARGRAADAEAASKLADVARGFLALGSLQMGELQELGSIVDSIQIDQLGDEVELSLRVPYETLKRLARRGRPQSGDRNF